ncbi:NAD-dependent dehydratase [Actinoplanes cyaneus]|uniref:NAD-dependent dehydratase n=1 Tax=Actinoplanes cyaneus TaxID=52696 RepID=A0A919M9P2_9ACTN|nr:SDR family oxidoreductase [Actinoplanes cyaneus]MCW2142899.1 putative NADH-flavin reductase [Actinoplanes cyaneus]GID69668.1 NAD-dependent dehydratase [Actinoplanes cyaneus]
MENARVLVVGGHGKVALLLLRLLIESGHQVSAVIRNPEHRAEVAESGADPLVADVEQLGVEELAELVRGHDAIVWSAGAGGGSPARTYAVDRDAAIRSMEAAALAGVQRYVMVSYFGSQLDHGVPEDSGFFPYAEAKAAADAYLERTQLDWTILGPSRLTAEPATGRIETASQGATAGSVSRADVAAVIARTLQEPATIRRTIRFNAGATPVADALSDEGDLA